jgi:hypothetical protein
MSATQYTLSPAALATVQQDVAAQNYPAAYTAIAQDLAGRADHDTIAWFTNAAQINDQTSTTFMHYFAPDFAQEVAVILGASTSNFTADFYNTSNKFAQATLSQIAASGLVDSFPVLGPIDTQNTAKTLPGGFLSWPGFAELCQPYDPVFQNTSYLDTLSTAARKTSAAALFHDAAWVGHLRS